MQTYFFFLCCFLFLLRFNLFFAALLLLFLFCFWFCFTFNLLGFQSRALSLPFTFLWAACLPPPLPLSLRPPTRRMRGNFQLRHAAQRGRAYVTLSACSLSRSLPAAALPSLSACETSSASAAVNVKCARVCVCVWEIVKKSESCLSHCLCLSLSLTSCTTRSVAALRPNAKHFEVGWE